MPRPVADRAAQPRRPSGGDSSASAIDEADPQAALNVSREQLAAACLVLSRYSKDQKVLALAARRAKRERLRRLTSFERTVIAVLFMISLGLLFFTYLALRSAAREVEDTVDALEKQTGKRDFPRHWGMVEARYIGAHWSILFAGGFQVFLFSWTFYIFNRVLTRRGYYDSDRISLRLHEGAVWACLVCSVVGCLMWAYAFVIPNVYEMLDPGAAERYPASWLGTDSEKSIMWYAFQTYALSIIAVMTAVSYSTSRFLLVVGSGMNFGVSDYFQKLRISLSIWSQQKRVERHRKNVASQSRLLRGLSGRAVEDEDGDEDDVDYTADYFTSNRPFGVTPTSVARSAH